MSLKDVCSDCDVTWPWRVSEEELNEIPGGGGGGGGGGSNGRVSCHT